MVRVLLLSLFALACPALAEESPLIIAHRGESSLAPENTLASMNLAWTLGDPGVELDYHLTADGRLAVIHDSDTRRTGDRALAVKDATFEQLQSIDVGRAKAARWAGERIPSLEQVIATLPEGGRMYIEIKTGPESVPALRKLLESCGKPASQFTVISFNSAAIAQVKQCMPRLQAFWISGLKQARNAGAWSPTLDELLATAKEIRADGLCIQGKSCVDQSFVTKIKAAGLLLNIWTIDTPQDVRRYLGYGVDSVTSNRAAWIREQLGIPGQKHATADR